MGCGMWQEEQHGESQSNNLVLVVLAKYYRINFYLPTILLRDGEGLCWTLLPITGTVRGFVLCSFPDLLTKQLILGTGGVGRGSELFVLPLRPYLQGLRDTEQLGYLARKKAFSDLSVTFLSTFSYHLGPCYLRSPWDTFSRKQMLSVSDTPALQPLPPRAELRLTPQPSFLPHPHIFVIKAQPCALTSLLPLLLILLSITSCCCSATGMTKDLQTPDSAPFFSFLYKQTNVYI